MMKETLKDMVRRAANAGCYIHFEFDVEEIADNFERGSYVAKFIPLPSDITELEKHLPGMSAKDYEVVLWELSDFEQVDYSDYTLPSEHDYTFDLTFNFDEDEDKDES